MGAMSFIETVERARVLLERNGRLSLRALRREFELDDEVLADLVEELTEVQRVAAREGNALSEQEDFEGASAQFQEAANAFKRSLRTRPGNRNAAWNLEYALDRIREEEEKQEE